MKLLNKTLNSNGAYKPICYMPCETCPEGFYQVADDVDIIDFANHCNFGTLSITDGVVTAITVDTAACDAFLASVEAAKQTRQAAIENLPQNRIAALKAQLSNTDYKAIKYAEGLISEADYAEIKTQRQEWRSQINTLEAQLDEQNN